MSELSPPHEAAHTGPIKNPRQLLLAVLFAFVVPIFAIIGLVQFVSSGARDGVGAADQEMAKARRLQKVGQVQLRAGDGTRALRSGEEVYKAQCMACHATGVSNAPKFSDAGDWAPRLGLGLEALAKSSIEGKGAMPPQGGAGTTDLEIARAVVYMANAAGGDFVEPAPPQGDEGEGSAEDAAESAPPEGASLPPQSTPDSAPDSAPAPDGAQDTAQDTAQE